MPLVPARAAATHDAPAPDPHDGPSDQERSPRWLERRGLVVGLLLAALGLPLIVAAIALRRPPWYPVLDLAMTELRLRDVGTSHTPLIGLPGRIGASLAQQGSHPGPLSFYVLAPLYRVFGSSAWAMQAATVVLDLVALGMSLLIATRRGSTRLVIAIAALLALLTAGFGIATLTEPWNPYLPLLWWVVLLLAVWSVACDDVAMLPVAVFAGSLCAQTHVPYLGLVLGLGAFAAIAAALAWRRAPRASDTRRNVARWAAVAVLLGVVLWTPPVIDQLTNDPGNLQQIYDHLATPPEDPVGFRRGVELALLHLDVANFVTTDSGANGSLVDASSDPNGSLVPGLAVLAVWAVAAITALRIGPRALKQLHLVVAVALVLGVVSMARIFGKEWFYLMLWSWAVAGLLLLAIGWTALVALERRLDDRARTRVANSVTIALVVVIAVSTALFTVDATRAEPPAPNLSSTLGAVLPATIAALERGDGVATGRDGRYTVTWTDAFYFGSQGYGVMSELERAGFDAGTGPPWHVPITDHRVIDPDDVTAVVHLATGVFVDRWRALPDAVEVAYVEPRSEAQRAEFEELHRAVVADLEGGGLDDIVPIVDENLFGASIDERVSLRAQRWMARMLELGEPTAVFIAPPGTSL